MDLRSSPRTTLLPPVLLRAPPCQDTGHLGKGQTGNLTFVNIKSPLGHVAHSSLRLLAAECVEVVDIWGFICDLKIANTAVTLQETGDKFAFKVK